MYPPSKIFAKLVNKNAIKHQKGVPSPKIFTTPIYPPSKNLTKTSWTSGFSNREHLCPKDTPWIYNY
jgi:hypothetical protein